MGELSRAALDELVAEAVVDAYGDDEQLTALYTMIEDNLAMPFDTTVLGVEVIVRRVDLHTDGIVAFCHRGPRAAGARHPGSSSARSCARGAQWIAAYRRWAGR